MLIALLPLTPIVALRASEKMPSSASARADEVALSLAQALVDGKYDAARARFAPALAAQLGPAALTAMLEERRQRAPLKSLTVRDRARDGAKTTITLHYVWSRGAASYVQLSVDADGAVTHLQIWDDDDPLYGYATKNALRPPFKGAWTAANAARDLDNHYYSNSNLRFAIDWVIRDRSGKTFRNDGKRNSDYYAYGQPALAPSSGMVVVAVDGLPENPIPGVVDRYDTAGNQVVIDIGHGEYAMLMHLMPGSLRVHRGERVHAGQVIARVGNSGHCSEPTLQFQLADHPRLTEARSLPTQFVRVLLDGEQAERVRPVYGNVIAPADHWDPNGPMHEDDDD